MNARQISVLVRRGTASGKALEDRVEETHISWVVFASRFAFKIKKPLRLSFLDFSSLRLRRKFCRKEVLLNRRFSSIYLSVEPVRYARGAWTIGTGAGQVRDYAVKMKKMDSAKRMDVVAREARLLREHVLGVAKVLAAFHRKARIVRSGADLDFLRSAFNDIRVIRSLVRKVFPRRYSTIIPNAISWSDAFLEAHAGRLRERTLLGFKRDVHGDLHMGNIFLYRRPVIFDCIEFNDRYRQIDVLDEAAFFCMDLEALGYDGLASAFIKAYTRLFRCIETKEDQRIFTFFKCYRANVRAKVHALAAVEERKGSAYTSHIKAVKQYLLLMEQYIFRDRQVR